MEERKAKRPAITQRQLEQIQQMAETLRYGSLSLVFQDGVLVQIERNEKIRFTDKSG